jgi:Rrf2 family iron-sulfur cluster assembly transcriptional regulator
MSSMKQLTGGILQLSRRADYGMRVILDLAALTEGERTSSREISRRQFIPLPFLSKIIAQLAAFGLVETQRGTQGGIRLVRPASEISMKDVFEALEGPIVFNRCLIHPEECPLELQCSIHDIWEEIQEQINTKLNEITFDELLRQQRAKRKSRRK